MMKCEWILYKHVMENSFPPNIQIQINSNLMVSHQPMRLDVHTISYQQPLLYSKSWLPFSSMCKNLKGINKNYKTVCC